MSEKERQLLGTARKGDIASYEELIEPYRAGIYSLMLNTCGDELEASLLSQDVFVRVFEALISDEFSGGLAFSVYKTAGEISRLAVCKSKMIS